MSLIPARWRREKASETHKTAPRTPVAPSFAQRCHRLVLRGLDERIAVELQQAGNAALLDTLEAASTNVLLALNAAWIERDRAARAVRAPKGKTVWVCATPTGRVGCVHETEAQAKWHGNTEGRVWWPVVIDENEELATGEAS